MEMKSFGLVIAVLCGSVLLSAEASISGNWATAKKSPVPVRMELKASGASLTGTVRVSDSPAFTILDGRIDGDRVSFKAMITEGDDQYPLMFSGRRSGNRINFKCEVETNPPGEKTELGPACLQSITVARVK
jgi:hypothetical protein